VYNSGTSTASSSGQQLGRLDRGATAIVAQRLEIQRCCSGLRRAAIQEGQGTVSVSNVPACDAGMDLPSAPPFIKFKRLPLIE
jgi:hypothetical protein